MIGHTPNRGLVLNISFPHPKKFGLDPLVFPISPSCTDNPYDISKVHIFLELESDASERLSCWSCMRCSEI